MPFFRHPDPNASISYDGAQLESFGGRVWAPAEAAPHMIAHGFAVDEEQDHDERDNPGDQPTANGGADSDSNAPADSVTIDPATASKDDLLTFLKERGEKVDGRTGEDKLRARAAELLAPAATESDADGK